jgi:hypothetical protein
MLGDTTPLASSITLSDGRTAGGTDPVEGEVLAFYR